MTTHLERSVTLAGEITARAEETLADLEREMVLRKWPAEFRALMWEAVANAARNKAAAARGKT